jgi:hypothetical protein
VVRGKSPLSGEYYYSKVFFVDSIEQNKHNLSPKEQT